MSKFKIYLDVTVRTLYILGYSIFGFRIWEYLRSENVFTFWPLYFLVMAFFNGIVTNMVIVFRELKLISLYDGI